MSLPTSALETLRDAKSVIISGAPDWFRPIQRFGFPALSTPKGDYSPEGHEGEIADLEEILANIDTLYNFLVSLEAERS